MSYTLKTQQIAVKDPETGAYSGVDILTEQTKSGLLAEIQAEGAAQRTSVTNTGVAQVSAVQAKGAETLASIPSDYTSLSNEVDDLKNTLSYKNELQIVPVLRNGSAGNPGNVNAISVKELFPVDNIKTIFINVNANKIPLIDGYYYGFCYTAYSVSSGNPASPSINQYVIKSIEFAEITSSPYAILELPSNTKGCSVWLYMTTENHASHYPLRVGNTDTDAISIIPLYDSIEIKSLREKLYTQLNRETFAYIGDTGSFSFYNINVFDANGRCAWRTNRGWVNIKLPNKNLKSFSVETIIASLSSDDLYNDGTTTWIYLRVGRALVYNDETESIESVAINALTPLADKAYPLIMMWSGQAVGGLLYPKFLSDAEKLNNLNERDRINVDVNKKLGNAQHIAHPYYATPTPPLTLVHFSDLHGDSAAMQRITKDKRTWDFEVDDIICTGDIVGNTAEQITSWWDSSILTCIGNHDSASYNASTGYDWTALSMADRDSYYIAPFESGWGIAHTAGTSYYYKDYTEQKVRLIVMDCMLYMSEGTASEATTQTTWLSNLLSDAIANALHVLIAIHAPHGGATATVCSFSKYGQTIMPTWGDCNTPQSVIDTVNTAITNGLHFIGYIVGHTHQDDIWDAENNNKQLMYCVTCAAVTQTAQWINSDQNRTGELDAYNIVTIDTDHTLVKLIRGGGADIDNAMRTRKGICFNYSTGENIGEIL